MTLSMTLIGGSTLLIEADGFRIVTDPTFDARGWAHLAQNGDDIDRAFTAFGLRSRLQMLAPGVATAIGFTT